MRIIGVTGGIGTGKSTVSKILGKNGAIIIDADQTTREIVLKSSVIVEKIRKTFGEEVIDEEGNVIRKVLASIVFNDKNQLEKLNKITHSEIGRIIKQNLNKLSNEDNKELIVIDAAIPFREGFLDVCNEIWVITSTLAERIKRLNVRSGYSEAEAMKRINSQLSEDEYRKIATKIIFNNCKIEELEKIVLSELNS